jgi:hypothetical protein
MSRVSRLLCTFLPLMVCAATAAAQSQAEMNQGNTAVGGPTYRYSLVEGQSRPVCKHMLNVFNKKFTNLWNPPDLISPTGTPNYSTNSKLAFPLFPGVKHSTEATFLMRFSSWPTSPVFAAIHWREGRAVLGGCPTCPWDHKLFPILVAHLDFDNDRTTDTVVKLVMNSGKYSTEHLFVWRGQVLKMGGAPSLWALQHPQDKELTPIIMSGTYCGRSFTGA